MLFVLVSGYIRLRYRNNTFLFCRYCCDNTMILVFFKFLKLYLFFNYSILLLTSDRSALIHHFY